MGGEKPPNVFQFLSNKKHFYKLFLLSPTECHLQLLTLKYHDLSSFKKKFASNTKIMPSFV